MFTEIGNASPSFYPDYHKRLTDWLQSNTPLNHPLLKLQQKSVAHFAAMKYALLADDMGLGKTAQALALDVLGGHKKTLIICPSNVKKVWGGAGGEIEKFTPWTMRNVFVGSGREFAEMPPSVINKFRYFVFNYEVLNVAAKTHKVLPELFRQCTHIILDECHVFRNTDSKKFIYFEAVMNHIPPQQLTMLTGTPVDRFVGELYVYLTLLDKNPHLPPDAPRLRDYIHNATAFNDRYANLRAGSGGGMGSKNFAGMKDGVLGEIKSLLGRRVCMRKKWQVVELPPREVREIQLENHQFQGINMAEVAEKFEKAIMYLGRSQANFKKYTQSLEDANDEGGGSGKQDMFLAVTQKYRRDIALVTAEHTWPVIAEMRERLGTGIIVFSEFIAPLLALKGLAKERGHLAVGQGHMDSVERDIHIRQFKEGKVDYLFATFGAMAMGENLQQSRGLVFNDPSWQPLMMEQAQCRIYRIGQRNPVEIVHMMCEGHEVVRRCLARKTGMIDKLAQVFGKLTQENNLI